MLVGRQIWVYIKIDDIAFFDGPYRVNSLRQILHAGPTERGPRLRSLVDVYTDPGGRRVLAVANIWARDPGRSESQW